MKARLVKLVKYDLSSRSSVFTPVSPISKTEILSGKYQVKFYRIPVSRSGISLLIYTLIYTVLRLVDFLALFSVILKTCDHCDHHY